MVLHGPADLRIAVSDDRLDAWQWLQCLPHRTCLAGESDEWRPQGGAGHGVTEAGDPATLYLYARDLMLASDEAARLVLENLGEHEAPPEARLIERWGALLSWINGNHDFAEVPAGKLVSESIRRLCKRKHPIDHGSHRVG